MAVATGTPIRPELSAVDYTPFLQAAGQSAQMQAQGIAALGAGVTKGFESFVQQQKENRQLEADVKSAERLGKSIQPFLKDINPEAQAEFGKLMAGVSDPNLSLRERSSNSKNLSVALNTLIGLAQQGKKAQDEKASAEVANIVSQGLSRYPAPLTNAAAAALQQKELSAYTPQQVMLGTRMAQEQIKTTEEIGKLRAEQFHLRQIPTPKTPTGEEAAVQAQIAAYIQTTGRQPDAVQVASIRDQVAKSRKTDMTIKTGDNLITGAVYANLNKDRDAAVSAMSSLQSFDESEKILKEGNAYTGTGAEAKLAVAKVFKFLGIEDSAIENTEVLKAQIARPVLALVKQLGANPSNTDLKFATAAAGGDIALDSKSIARLISIGRKMANNLVESYNQRLDQTYPEADQDNIVARRSLMLPSSKGQNRVYNPATGKIE